MKMTVTAMMLSLFILVATVDAQMLYRYVDEQGQVHVTDDPNKLPKAKGTVDVMRAPQAPPSSYQPPPASVGPRTATAPDRATEVLFDQAAKDCARQTGAEAYSATGRDLRWFGTNRERFNFERCMAGRGFPVSGDK